jgi:REP element-mobilizing transposase RayT
MARPLRLEFAGALYHVTARGDRREPIYTDEADRHGWLDVLGEVCGRFNWVVHAYCQMTNHYHLLVETADGNLSKGMRQLNGLYTQRFNRRHSLVGHLFQGRYKAILVQKENYLLELSRYVVLNPVRAGMVGDALDWPWSSFGATIGKQTESPDWLDTEWMLSLFGGERGAAATAYARFVCEGGNGRNPWRQVQHQMFLGDEAFVGRFQGAETAERLRDVSLAQRRSVAKPLETYRTVYSERNEAMARAYLSGAYTMREIGDFFGVHYMTVSRAVRQFEQSERATIASDDGERM